MDFWNGLHDGAQGKDLPSRAGWSRISGCRVEDLGSWQAWELRVEGLKV